VSRKLSDLTPDMQIKVGVLFRLADEAGLSLLAVAVILLSMSRLKVRLV
jgi:hypothetical protein